MSDIDDETYDYYRGVKIGTEMAAARIAELEEELHAATENRAPSQPAHPASDIDKAQVLAEAEARIAELEAERDVYNASKFGEQARRIEELEAERDKAVAQVSDLARRMGDDIVTLRAEVAARDNLRTTNDIVANGLRLAESRIRELEANLLATCHDDELEAENVKLQGRIAELEVEREHAVYAYVSARIAELETELEVEIGRIEAERDTARASLAICSKGFDAVCKVNSELQAEARAWEKMAREAADRIYARLTEMGVPQAFTNAIRSRGTP